MKKKMLQFVDLKQETPEKRNTSKRKGDFKEIYNEFITDKASEQSSRCSIYCSICQIHCPLGNNIPDWLKLTAEGRLKEAYEISQRLIICLKFVEEFVLKIGYVREIV